MTMTKISEQLVTMTKISEQLVTKDQLEIIYAAWGTAAEIPSGKKKSLVVWPYREHAEITKTMLKSEYGKRLFRIEFFRH